MRDEVVEELNRRTDVIIANSSSSKIHAHVADPSLIMWFDTTLSPLGYAFEDAPEWMDWADEGPIMDRNEYFGNTYGDVIFGCFVRVLDTLNGR